MTSAAPFTVEWLRDTADSRLAPTVVSRLRYVAETLTYAAVGTFVDATLGCEGDPPDIIALGALIGRGCNVRDARADIVWSGVLHELSVYDGVNEHTITLEEFANAVAAVYYQVSSSAVDFGKRTMSAWSIDYPSMQRYGTHERIVTRQRMTAAEATTELSRVLALTATPEYSVGHVYGNDVTKRWRARLTLKGHWYYLQRKTFSDLSCMVRLADESGAGHDQNFGEGSGIQDVFFPFTASSNAVWDSGLPPSEITYRAFDANKVTLKLRKVVDGWGASAQPTDGVVVDIIADAPLGIYLGDVASYGNHGDELWTLTGPMSIKDKNGNPTQGGTGMDDMNWRGVWLGAKVNVMIGRPWYGQTDLAGYPVTWEKRVQGNSFGVAAIPELAVAYWPLAGAGPLDGGWDSSGAGLTYRVGTRFGLQPGPQSTQQVNGAPFSVPGPDMGADGATPNVIATSETVPASKISTSQTEVTFTFATPFRVDGTRRWIRVRRTEPWTNKNEYHWRGKGYYVVGGHKLVAAHQYSLLTRVWRSDLKHWKCAIPPSYRDGADGQSQAPLPVHLWHKITGDRETSEQLRLMGDVNAGGRIAQTIVDGARLGSIWTSGVYTVPYQSGERVLQDTMAALLERGDAQGKRMTYAIVPRTNANWPSYPLGVIRFEPDVTTALVWTRDGRLMRYGVERDPLPPPVGQWIRPEAVTGVDQGGRAPAFFCEEAQWTPDNGLELRPRRAMKFNELPTGEDTL